MGSDRAKLANPICGFCYTWYVCIIYVCVRVFFSSMKCLTSCKPCITIINVYRPSDRSLATFFEVSGRGFHYHCFHYRSSFDLWRFQCVRRRMTVQSTRTRWCIRDTWTGATRSFAHTSQSGSSPRPHHLGSAFQHREVRVIDSGAVSDHQLIVASLDIGPSSSSRRPVTFTIRRIKNIDPSDFEARLHCSPLYTSQAEDTESFANQIKSVVTTVLDEVASLEKRSRCPPKAITRWLSDDAIAAKRHRRRRLERKWQETRSDTNRLLYRRVCRHANKLINTSRQDYFHEKLSSATDCKKRWQVAKELLHLCKTVHEHTTEELKQLCSKFALFFINKIVSLKQTVSATLASLNACSLPDPIHTGETFESIANVSADEVRRLITSMPSKSSSVDFIPTSLLKHCPSVFSEMIARLSNLSFSGGVFPSKFKCAAVTPLLKKPSLDPDNPSSYRPISNLNTISKILERLFLSRLYPHVTSSSNFNHLQSAYRPFHSTETALLQTFDNTFHSADLSQPTLLVSLDLSAAFDTIDHATLLSRLSTSFGVHGTALAWLTSYLTNRSQTVRMGSVSSNPSNFSSGVPQGSVLGPILFSLYISPIGQIVSNFGLAHQQYADDSQLYISLKGNNVIDSTARLGSLLGHSPHLALS